MMAALHTSETIFTSLSGLHSHAIVCSAYSLFDMIETSIHLGDAIPVSIVRGTRARRGNLIARAHRILQVRYVGHSLIVSRVGHMKLTGLLSLLPCLGIYNLRETAELCCKQYFSSHDLSTCIEASKADVLTEEGIVAFKATRPKRFYPDLFAKQNCVFDSDYYDWMVSVDVSSFGEKWVYFSSCGTHTCSRMRITFYSALKKNAAIDGTRHVQTVRNYWYRLLRIK